LGTERGKVDDLAGQLDSLATSTAATATRISGSEEEISAIRSYVEDGAQRLSSHVAELKQSVAALAARATAIEDSDGEVARVLDERVSGMSGSVDHLAAQLDSLTATVGTMSGRIGKRDVELDTRLVEIAGRVDNLVAELSRALTELPDPASTEQALEAHLGEFDRVRTDDRARVEEVADRLEALVASFASMADRGPASEALERRIDELVERIDDAVDDRATTSSEVARLAAILEVERGAVRSRLESLAAAVESSTGTLTADEVERRVTGFDGRVAAAERDREALTTAVGQLAGAVDADRASFQTQLEALAAALSWTSTKSSIEDRLQGLDTRMGDLERRNAEVSSKVSQATTLLPTALRSLEARLDEVAPGTRAATTTEHVPPPQPAPRGRLERRPHDPDDESAEDAAPDRMPTAVVPFRGTDP
jgi:chromosome segregation ATPase